MKATDDWLFLCAAHKTAQEVNLPFIYLIKKKFF